ncbi:MAG: hypothetical protein GXP37_02750 [Chloroflexi bacterium]|nr:hypothetical protein [Chloroflexota bacterium]
MMKKRLSLVLLGLGLLLAACGPPATPDTATSTIPTSVPPVTSAPPTTSTALAEARRDQVQTVASNGARKTLPASSKIVLHVGEGIDVDTSGSALIKFADLLVVEVTRHGSLQLQEYHVDDESALVDLLQATGVLLGNFNPQKDINRRLSIDADFAQIEVTGTRFLIAHEENNPLLWVVALDAGSDDLRVTAGGATRGIVTGRALWVAPVGEPSAGIKVAPKIVEEWAAALLDGRDQPALGEVIWPQADVLAPTSSVSRLPEPGEPFEMNGVSLTLSPRGMNGNPGYGLNDCNGDGIDDIVMDQGMITFDFRNVLARVHSLDVTVRNYADPGSGVLRAFDPERDEIAHRLITAGPDEFEVLDLRSSDEGQIYHYATLSMTAGCFLGFSLTPPTAGSDAPPRSAVPLETLLAPEKITPETTPLSDLLAYAPTLVEGNKIECAYENIGKGSVTESAVLLIMLVNGERVSYGTISTPIAPGGSGWLRSQALELPAQFNASCLIDARDQVQESNEDNNQATALLTPSSGCPYPPDDLFAAAQQEMELGCAQSAAYGLTSSWQPFSQGAMLWRKDTNLIYVLVSSATVTPLIPPGQWQDFDNGWQSGMPEYSCPEAEALAEAGTPVHFGFGYLWCNDGYLQENVGDPTDDESGGERWYQPFSNGWAMHIGEWDDSIVVLRDDGIWVQMPR